MIKYLPTSAIYKNFPSVTILLGDSLELMQKMGNNSVNLIVTDPPYNISNNNKLTKVGQKIVSTNVAWGREFNDQWSSIEAYYSWLREYIKEFYRILVQNGSLILFVDRNYSGFFVYNIEKDTNFIFRNKIYFEKINPLPHFRQNNYRSCIEEALWFSKTNQYYLNFISQDKMLQIFRGSIGKKKTTHPTEKYRWMIDPIIERHSKEGDIVFDAFAGSGTVGESCLTFNRKCIMIEKKPEYCQLISDRIDIICKQSKLF